MKTLLLIIFICFNIYAVPDCYKSFSGAVEKVDNIYKKAQYRHSLAFKDEYHYEICPNTMFPLFCVPEDTVKKLLDYGANYLCGSTVTIGLNMDKNFVKHIQIAVLQYTSFIGYQPATRVYTMYFFKFFPVMNDWVEDRAPITVILYLKKDGSYMSK